MVKKDKLKLIEAEKEAVGDYIKDNAVEDMVHDVVEALLKDKPSNPKRYILSWLGEDGEEGGQRRVSESSITEVPGHHLIRLFEATRNISAEIVPKETITIIINESIKLLECDRVSLFVYDKKINMLVLNASNLSTPIRVSPGQGFAGIVFSTQETVNIPDCYKDDRFDSGFDKRTGYHTKSILAMPIVDFEGSTLGVLQAINKVDEGEFTQIDELLLGHLTQHAGIALRNAEVYRDAIIQSERAQGLLHMIQSLSQDLGMQSLVLNITMHANELVQADRCTVFLVDEAKQQLWSVSSDSGKEIRIPKTAGIAGECACSGELINIPDAYQDSRFNQAFDKKTGYKTQSVLAVPVLSDMAHGRVLAVIQMINKMEFDGEVGVFDDEDVNVMETFSKFVGGKLQACSSLLTGKTKKKGFSEAENAFGDDAPSSGGSSPAHKSRKSQADSMVIEEDEEEDAE